MPIMTIGTGRTLISGGRPYYKKILSYGPIAYWPLWETAGTVAQCLTNPAMNGTYARNVPAMGTGIGIGDGPTAPTFDGVNDVVDVHSAALAAAFNGAEGTLMTWCRWPGAAFWTDGVGYNAMRLSSDINNVAQINKTTTNNLLSAEYTAGGVYLQRGAAGQAQTIWFLFWGTWSKSADQLRGYVNTAEYAPIINGLGVWANPLAAGRCVIGAVNLGPAAPWVGRLCHAAVWDRPLSLAEGAALYYAANPT